MLDQIIDPGTPRLLLKLKSVTFSNILTRTHPKIKGERGSQAENEPFW